jgi:hypothetical protein
MHLARPSGFSVKCLTFFQDQLMPLPVGLFVAFFFNVFVAIQASSILVTRDLSDE